ncbi:hypothetical protein [Roseateles sp. YR242]|nr:hypothetical protein [Roseateles sp. YR242]
MSSPSSLVRSTMRLTLAHPLTPTTTTALIAALAIAAFVILAAWTSPALA